MYPFLSILNLSFTSSSFLANQVHVNNSCSVSFSWVLLTSFGGMHFPQSVSQTIVSSFPKPKTIISVRISHHILVGIAMGWGGVGPKDGVFVPALYSFVLSHYRLAPHDGENFLTPSPPLGALRSPVPPRKTLLSINFPYNQYNFFNETYFINKNILEITTKFIPSNQINFLKLILICLFKQQGFRI